MKNGFGPIIKMPTEQASPEEIEERKSKFYNLLAKWAFEAYLKDHGMEDILKGVELMRKKAQHPEEKQTDVNIARDVLVDAITDNVDLIYIFSTDSDFVPIVDYILNTLNPKIEEYNLANQAFYEQGNLVIKS